MLNAIVSSDISFAKIEDISGVMQVLKQNYIPPNNINKSLETKGFLIRSFTPIELNEFILDSRNNLVLIAKQDNEVIGYALSHDLQHHKPAWIANNQMSHQVIDLFSTEKILYLSTNSYSSS